MDDKHWGDLYPELVNKIRWAIQTTYSTPEFKFPYQASQAIATVLAGDVTELLKLSVSQPGVTGSTGAVRGFFIQKQVDKTLNGR